MSSGRNAFGVTRWVVLGCVTVIGVAIWLVGLLVPQSVDEVACGPDVMQPGEVCTRNGAPVWTYESRKQELENTRPAGQVLATVAGLTIWVTGVTGLAIGAWRLRNKPTTPQEPAPAPAPDEEPDEEPAEATTAPADQKAP